MSALAGIRIQLERQVIGIESARPINHEHAKRVVADHAVKLFRARFFKMLR